MTGDCDCTKGIFMLAANLFLLLPAKHCVKNFGLVFDDTIFLEEI